jgi:small subunit ribosomal protein S6
MNSYEAMFIFKPDLDVEKLDKEIKSVEKTLKTRGKGDVKYDTLGKKTLAYEINKYNEGVYVNYTFTAQPLSIVKIKESIKHKDDILRFMILVRDKDV